MSRRHVTPVRFPWENLERVARVPIHYHAHTTPTRFDYARYFDVNVQTIDRWRCTGIPWHRADVLAVKYVGVHPGSIWPNWFDLELAA